MHTYIHFQRTSPCEGRLIFFAGGEAPIERGLVRSNPDAGKEPELKPTAEQQRQIDANEKSFGEKIQDIRAKMNAHLGNTRFDEVQFSGKRHGEYNEILLTTRANEPLPPVVREYAELYNIMIKRWEAVKTAAERGVKQKGEKSADSVRGLLEAQNGILQEGTNSLEFKMRQIEMEYAGERSEPIAKMAPDRLQQLVREDENAFMNALAAYEYSPTAANRQIMLGAIGRIEQRARDEQVYRESWGLIAPGKGNRMDQLRSLVDKTGEKVAQKLQKDSDAVRGRYEPFNPDSRDAAVRILEEEQVVREALQAGPQYPEDTALASARGQFGLDGGAAKKRNVDVSRLATLHGDRQFLAEVLPKRIEEDMQLADTVLRGARQRLNRSENPVMADTARQNVTGAVAKIGQNQDFYRQHHATGEEEQMKKLAEARQACGEVLALDAAEGDLLALRLGDLEKQAEQELTPEEIGRLLQQTEQARAGLRGTYDKIAALPSSPWKSSLGRRLVESEVDVSSLCQKRFDSERQKDHPWKEGDALYKLAERSQAPLREAYKRLQTLKQSPWRDALMERLVGKQVPDAQDPGKLVWKGGVRERLGDTLNEFAKYIKPSDLPNGGEMLAAGAPMPEVIPLDLRPIDEPFGAGEMFAEEPMPSVHREGGEESFEDMDELLAEFPELQELFDADSRPKLEEIVREPHGEADHAPGGRDERPASEEAEIGKDSAPGAPFPSRDQRRGIQVDAPRPRMDTLIAEQDRNTPGKAGRRDAQGGLAQNDK